MTAVRLADTAEITGTRRTRDGYLVGTFRIAKANNIQTYGGAELGRPDMPEVRVWRPEDAIFDGAAMRSWAFKPVTFTHPKEQVSADNWRDHAIGLTGGEIARDGDFLAVPMVLMDADTIAAVEDGSRELSCGYTTELAWDAGVTPDGQSYHAKVVAITGNHVAIVRRGRAGPECRIGDAGERPAADPPSSGGAGAPAGGSPPAPSPSPTTTGDRAMPDANLRAVVVDGISIEVPTQGAQVIERLQRQLSDAATAAATQRTEHQRALDAAQGQVAALQAEHRRATEAAEGRHAAALAEVRGQVEARDGELAALRAQIPDAAALDALLTQRLATADAAARVHGAGFDPRGLSEAEMRRRAVARRLGDAAVANRSDEYVQAAFDTLAAQAAQAPAPQRPDPLAQALAAGAGTVAAADAQPRDPTAWERNAARIRDAWKTPGQEAA